MEEPATAAKSRDWLTVIDEIQVKPPRSTTHLQIARNLGDDVCARGSLSHSAFVTFELRHVVLKILFTFTGHRSRFLLGEFTPLSFGLITIVGAFLQSKWKQHHLGRHPNRKREETSA